MDIRTAATHFASCSIMSKYLESADFVARYMELDTAKVSTASSTFATIPPPDDVVARLGNFNLTWSDLPPLAQQALLWDMGFVAASVGGSDQWFKVYVKCGLTMAVIFVPFAEFTATGDGQSQSALACNATQGSVYSTYYRQQLANYTQVDSVLRCAIALDAYSEGNSAMMAQDAMAPTDVPELRVLRHEDPVAQLTKPAIHSTPRRSGAEPAWGKCSSTSSGLVVPCEVYGQHTKSLNICRPNGSSVMTSWLQAIKTTVNTTKPGTTSPTRAPVSSHAVLTELSPSPTIDLFPLEPTPAADSNSWPSSSLGSYVGVGVAVVFLIFLWFYCRRRYQLQFPTNRNPMYYEDTSDQDSLQSLRRQLHPFASPMQVDTQPALTLLAEVRHKELQYNALIFDGFLLSASRFDVYYGHCGIMPVAIKTLAVEFCGEQAAVDEFAHEIHLHSRCSHANIVAVVGFAWQSTIATLALATELLQEGTLRDYLEKQQPGSDWHAKATVALDIARALNYLHTEVQPTIVHCNVKSTNVLLQWPHAKLAGFDKARQMIYDQMLTGSITSTSFTAPEALCGDDYGTPADIYSFGCLLLELDCHTPVIPHFSNSLVEYDSRLSMENLVSMTETMTCPYEIAQLIKQCLERDPAMRPSALHVIDQLEDIVRGYSACEP
ncbi:hypothetical protein Ae201684P_001801 [Aphanomyces euteiches]|uniref:Protein kinase domain-containing protein n=1 Tax=Aphanomyces euteiches TaxID=100861 RepID=A0A6G0XLK9_9STRA|nr:hypothetical protein Ae201684_003675 [Aphanomyces euteiches]KAH9084559.1 hypothetical protein Ae201684P_001801 [Aphanomyces euteiches]